MIRQVHGTHECSFSFRGLRIEVAGTDPAPLRWLEEFLSPQLRDDTRCVRLQRVVVVIDAERYGRAIAEGPQGEAAEIDCFTLHDGFARHALWRDEPEFRQIHIAEAEALLRIPADGTVIEIVARIDRWKLRNLLMRVVRELATLEALHRGDLFVHGAAAVVGGRAVVFAGSKRAGKTTMLLNALRQPGVRFLSNDRVLVDLDREQPLARGMPTIVRVRGESVQHLPSLAGPAWQRPHRHYLTLAECANGSSLIEPSRTQPPGMSPPQLCRWLGVEPIAGATLGAMVFPRVDPAVQRFELRPLSVAEATDRLAASLFSCGPSGVAPRAFAGLWAHPFPDAAAVHDRCRRLAQRVTCLECRTGERAFHEPNVWKQIIARLGRVC